MDGTVRQWDVSEQRNVTEQSLLSTVPGEIRIDPFTRIISLSMCANGILAVSLLDGGTVQIWDMLTGEAVGRPYWDTQAKFGCIL